MRVLALGPLEIVGTGASVPKGDVARRVLAVLVQEANRPVHADRLTDLVWPEAGRTSGNSLQAHISRWRRALGVHRITFTPAGYSLLLGPDELDVLEFEKLARVAASERSNGDPTAAAAACDAALSLWRGVAFSGLDDDSSVQVRRTELETLRAEVELARLEAWCETGAYDRVLTTAPALTDAEPWNEPVHCVLARSQYARGDQVGALRTLEQLELRLRHDLGLDLAVPTRSLREQILRQEPALDPTPRVPVVATPTDRMEERIGDLPELTRRVLTAAALSGSDVDTAQVGRALDVKGAELADALSPALRAGIVVRTQTGVRFGNQSVQETVASLVSPGDALALHRRLGQALLARRSPGTLPAAADHLAAAAASDGEAALQATLLDHELSRDALAHAHHVDAVAYGQRALVSVSHVPAEMLDQVNRADLRIALAEAHQRSGDLVPAMTEYSAAAALPDVTPEVLMRAALEYEECSLHARRHRTGPRDRSIVLLEQALDIADSNDPIRVDLLGALAQALTFSGRYERAASLGDQAVCEARRLATDEVLARALLRRAAACHPVREAANRLELTSEAAELGHRAGADEIELDALCAWVPELMRANRIDEAEQVIGRVESLSDAQGNVLHRYKAPMWRAALALWHQAHVEAEILIEDFWALAKQDGYEDADRVRGFQSILLCLGRGEPDRAAKILDEFSHDDAFEPWNAAALLVAGACGDTTKVQQVLVPWSARRFAFSRPFNHVQTFCVCLVADVVAEHGDAAARERLAGLVAIGVGQNQVLGSGAALLDDPQPSLQRLTRA